jgi:HSP20 family protein
MFGRRLYRGEGSLLNEIARLRELDSQSGTAPDYHQIPYPGVNVWAGPDRVVLTAEVPGLKQAELDIKVVGASVTLSGKPNAEKGERHYLRVEQRHSPFSRTIGLPFTVENDKVEARLDRGILYVTMPRAEADKPRKITIKSA